MTINSKQKGARFERQLAGLLREHGFESRRSVQYCGANGDADVIGVPGVHIEAKAVEKLNIHEAMEQSIKDARDGEIPVVIHKRNRKPILVTMLFEDWIEFYKKGLLEYRIPESEIERLKRGE